MSNSIYNGSFVLGDVSATTLSAGPGIKIDDSQPGVIKVSNDETVLWENSTTANAASCTLSENASAFERFKIFTTTVTGSSQIVNEFETSPNNEIYDVICPGGNNQPVIKFVQFTVNGTSVSSTRCASLFFNSYGGSPTYRFNNSDDLKIIHKVIGINRKQNGGN